MQQVQDSPSQAERSSSEDGWSVTPTISSPKGAAIRGIGEEVAAKAVAGTGSSTMPVASRLDRPGFGPQLFLSHASGGEIALGLYLTPPRSLGKPGRFWLRYHHADEYNSYITENPAHADGRVFGKAGNGSRPDGDGALYAGTGLLPPRRLRRAPSSTLPANSRGSSSPAGAWRCQLLRTDIRGFALLKSVVAFFVTSFHQSRCAIESRLQSLRSKPICLASARTESI